MSATFGADREALREAALESLYVFARWVLGFDYMVPHVHAPLCEFLERPSKRKQVTLPRGFLKTTVCVVAYGLWRAVRNSNIRILVAMKTLPNSMRTIDQIRSIVERNELFRSLFPEVVPDDFREVTWSAQAATLKRSGVFREATFEAAGIGTTLTSRHYDLIIEDDLVAPDKDDLTGLEAMPSREEIEKAIGWHKLARSLLVSLETGEILNIGTRWSKYDLIQYIIDNEPNTERFELAALDERGEPTYPERFPRHVLEEIEREQGTYIFACTPAETPILMADWSTKPISQVQVGDEVVGWVKEEGKRRRFVKAVVKGVYSRVQQVYKLYLVPKELLRQSEEPGLEDVRQHLRVVRCTADHKWFTGRDDGTHPEYAPARVGRALHRIIDWQLPELDEEQKWLAAWLAGIFDGEGTFNEHGILSLSQSPTRNPDVYHGILLALERLGFQYEVVPQSKQIRLLGGRNTIRRWLHQVRPLKWRDRMIAYFYNHGGRITLSEDVVIAMVPDSVETVYALETTTGNYVAWGYASSNSQYLNKPYDEARMVFRDEWLSHAWEKLPEGIAKAIVVDPAISKRSEAAYSVVAVLGAHEGKLYVLDYRRGKWSPSELIEQMFDAATVWGVIDVYVEAVQWQEALAHFFERFAREQGKWLNVVPIKPGPDESKDLRIRGLQPFAQRGDLLLAPWMRELRVELRDFPFSKTKDIADAVAYGPRVLAHALRATSAPVVRRPVGETFGDVIDRLRRRGTNLWGFRMNRSVTERL